MADFLCRDQGGLHRDLMTQTHIHLTSSSVENYPPTTMNRSFAKFASDGLDATELTPPSLALILRCH